MEKKTWVLVLSLSLTFCLTLGKLDDLWFYFLLNEGVADVSPGALSNSEIWVTNIY